MAISYMERKKLLAAGLPETREVRLELQDYLARAGLVPADFAHRINYSKEAVCSFLSGNYQRISSNDSVLRAAIRSFIACHPVAQPGKVSGTVYETENVRILRKYFREALEHRRAYYVYGAPGTQKSFVLQHLVAELNRQEVGKDGAGRRAYYIYVRQGIRTLDLMKRIAETAGAITLGTVERILGNLRFDLGGRQVLLVFDEAQHLSIECLETIRELFDRPPQCALLFAGSHELEEMFTRHALELEQWRSRFHAGRPLPGISEEEAQWICREELGPSCSAAIIRKLVKKARVVDLRHGAEHSYVSTRRLFWTLRELGKRGNIPVASRPPGPDQVQTLGETW